MSCCKVRKMLKQRKSNRLQNFDYSSPGAYFVTICTKDRKPMFWRKNVGEDIIFPTLNKPDIPLNALGKKAESAIRDIEMHYSNVTVEKYVVMPNHIHIILMLHADAYGRMISSPTVSTVVGQLKRKLSKESGIDLWQRSFHDHIIRAEQDF